MRDEARFHAATAEAPAVCAACEQAVHVPSAPDHNTGYTRWHVSWLNSAFLASQCCVSSCLLDTMCMPKCMITAIWFEQLVGILPGICQEHLQYSDVATLLLSLLLACRGADDVAVSSFSCLCLISLHWCTYALQKHGHGCPQACSAADMLMLCQLAGWIYNKCRTDLTSWHCQ